MGEVVPEAEGEAASEAVGGDVEVEGVSRPESWQDCCIISCGDYTAWSEKIRNWGTVCCKILA